MSSFLGEQRENLRFRGLKKVDLARPSEMGRSAAVVTPVRQSFFTRVERLKFVKNKI